MNMPESDYETRMDDPRVGYFLTQTNNMTSTDVVNYRDFYSQMEISEEKS